MPDIRRMGATMLAYTGKVLNYILAVPPSPDDASSPLTFAFGNEASEADIREFAAPVRLRGARQLRLDRGADHHPPRRHRCRRGALGSADDNIARVRSRHRARSARVPSSTPRDGSRNADAAVGEIVNTAPGDDVRGLLPQRGGQRLQGARRHLLVGRPRVPRRRRMVLLRRSLERVAARRRRELRRRAGRARSCCAYPGVRSAAVYAVPDDPVGDRVMVAIEVEDDAGVRPRRRSTSSCRRSPTSGPSGCRASCGSPPSCRSSRA